MIEAGQNSSALSTRLFEKILCQCLPLLTTIGTSMILADFMIPYFSTKGHSSMTVNSLPSRFAELFQGSKSHSMLVGICLCTFKTSRYSKCLHLKHSATRARALPEHCLVRTH